MTAIITVSLDHIHPVIEGRWHMISQLEALPRPGETITTLCGITETVEYQAKHEQLRPPHVCWDCDDEYRKQNGLPPARY